MQTNASLNEKIVKAVQTSMRIEGYESSQALKARAAALVEMHRIEISPMATDATVNKDEPVFDAIKPATESCQTKSVDDIVIPPRDERYAR